jgi:hypothetical protein
MAAPICAISFTGAKRSEPRHQRVAQGERDRERARMAGIFPVIPHILQLCGFEDGFGQLLYKQRHAVGLAVPQDAGHSE